jgi:hypothetical protein
MAKWVFLVLALTSIPAVAQYYPQGTVVTAPPVRPIYPRYYQTQPQSQVNFFAGFQNFFASMFQPNFQPQVYQTNSDQFQAKPKRHHHRKVVDHDEDDTCIACRNHAAMEHIQMPRPRPSLADATTEARTALIHAPADHSDDRELAHGDADEPVARTTPPPKAVAKAPMLAGPFADPSDPGHIKGLSAPRREELTPSELGRIHAANAGERDSQTRLVWKPFIKAWAACVPDPGCQPIGYNAERENDWERSCHGQGRAIDVFGMQCGNRKIMALNDSADPHHEFGKLVACVRKNAEAQKKNPDTHITHVIYQQGGYMPRGVDAQTSQHWNHAHFSIGCNLPPSPLHPHGVRGYW